MLWHRLAAVVLGVFFCAWDAGVVAGRFPRLLPINPWVRDVREVLEQVQKSQSKSQESVNSSAP